MAQRMQITVRGLSSAVLLLTLFNVAACDIGHRPTGDTPSSQTENKEPPGPWDDPTSSSNDTTGGEGNGGSTGGDTTPVDPLPSYEIVTCANALQSTSQDCQTVIGDTRLIITATLLQPGRVTEGGQVLVGVDGRIQCVGCDCAAQAVGATQLTCANTVLTPGLINAHDHLGWAGDAPYVAADATVRYEHRHDWRRGDSSQNEAEVVTRGRATNNEKMWAELRFVLGGATSTNGSGASRGLLRNLDQANGRLGLSGTPVIYETFPLGDSNGVTRNSGCAYPEMEDPNRVASASAYTPHIAEGITTAARNEFMCLSGSAPSSVNVIGSNVAVIHGIGVDAMDIAMMAATGTQLIWSPRSNVSLYGTSASVPVYHRMGVPISLGTDWMPSGSMNLLRELQCASHLNEVYYHQHFSAQDLWRMVTVNPAQALAVSAQVGRLLPGMVADIALFKRPQGIDAFAAVVQGGVEHVRLVLRGGQILSGDADVVDALQQEGVLCESLDVCGAAKSVCLLDDIGQSFADLSAAQRAAIYPLFYCGTPDNEPSCEPWRGANDALEGASSYQGIVPGQDSDGDGVADTTDNCLDVFNPILPMDLGSQSDYDGDGFGDMCDVCPMASSTTQCPTFSLDDRDADGRVNDADNCRDVANADQRDTDADGHGDVCDICPAVANPGTQGCHLPIYDIKQGLVAVGMTVALRDLNVTGIAANGFFAQLASDSSDYNADLGPRFSGIYVYTGGAPAGLAVGDTLDVSRATLANYYGEWQLQNATWERHQNRPGLVLPAQVALDDLSASDGNFAYEAVLVNVQNTLVSSIAPPPGTGDTAQNEIELENKVRLDDLLGFVSRAWQVQDQLLSVTGVVTWRNSLVKILPRTRDDIVWLNPPIEPEPTDPPFVPIGALDLSGYHVTQQNATRTLTFEAGTIVSPDSYIVMARSATREAFEQFWQVTLADNVVFINSENNMPQINGDEVYAITDRQGNLVGDMSVAAKVDKCFMRSTVAGAWQELADTPGTVLVGSSQSAGGAPGLFVSQFCDASGTGNFVYEFVELYFGGAD